MHALLDLETRGDRRRAPAPAPRATVTLLPGDGVGPEVMEAAVRVLAAAGAPLDWERCEAGASVFARGVATGIPDEAIDSIRRNRVLLKGPLETPVGTGGKSANVTLRKLFETYANVRPARELPGVPTPFTGRGIDLVIVRENVEDLYAGIEHLQSPGVAQALKLVTRRGSERVIRAAFELARAEGRGLVHCATKANILKLTEGLFKRVFEEVAQDYPEIRAEHILVDNCAHQLVLRPESFQVIVTTNMNGDILSDLASGLVGGLGFAPSANLGDGVAVFEPVHGTAPDIAGKGIANPTAAILAAVGLLRHLGYDDHAAKVENALLWVLESGKVRTRDFASGAKAVGTAPFADAVADALGRAPRSARAARSAPPERPSLRRRGPAAGRQDEPHRSLLGMDVFIESPLAPRQLGRQLELLAASGALRLKMISNRGTQVYPKAGPVPDCADVHRCRFVAREGRRVEEGDLVALLGSIARSHRWVHVERLQVFDGLPGYSLAQGER